MNELQHDLDVVSDALAKVSRQPSIWQWHSLSWKHLSVNSEACGSTVAFPEDLVVEGQQPNDILYSYSLMDY